MPASSDPTSAADLVSYVFEKYHDFGDKKIYVDAEQPADYYTANEALKTVRQLIAGFKHYGLKRGDCVCVHSFNDISYPLLFLAIVGAGGIFTGPNPAYTPTELCRHIKMTEAKMLITEPSLCAKSLSCFAESGIGESEIFLFETRDQRHSLQFKSWKQLLQHGEAEWDILPSEQAARQTTAALLSTSGTSGLPKAAMISHWSLISECSRCDDSHIKPFEVSRLIALPVFHAFAFPMAHLSPLRKGITTYMMRRMDLPKFLELIRKFQITETAIVPPVVTAIIKSFPQAYRCLRSLRTVWCAGAPLALGPNHAFYRLLAPTTRMIQVWGMTEAGWITSFLWPERDNTGSVGRELPGMEATILYNNIPVLNDDVQGEIFVRGEFIMQGYLNNPEASASTISSDGWLRTGDLGYRHKGKFYIVDRQKELIKVRGWQVSPAEIESQLLLHSDVRDVAVIGVPACPYTVDDEEEYPRAYIVRRPGSILTEEHIRSFMSERLAKYKSLDGGICFVDAIPKSSTGKTLKKTLQRLAALERSRQREALTISIAASLPEEIISGDALAVPLSSDSVPIAPRGTANGLRSSTTSTSYASSTASSMASVASTGPSSPASSTMVMPCDLTDSQGKPDKISDEKTDSDLNHPSKPEIRISDANASEHTVPPSTNIADLPSGRNSSASHSFRSAPIETGESPPDCTRSLDRESDVAYMSLTAHLHQACR